MMEFLASKWAKWFFVSTGIQALICMAFEAYVFGKFQTNVKTYNGNSDDVESQYRTIPTFLTLIIFGFIYDMVLVWDALRMKNTIQIVGLCVANLAFLVYTALQVDQIQSAVLALNQQDLITDPNFWTTVKPYLIAIPVIIGLNTLILGFLAWKLYSEFAWDILKQIGADYRMKKRFLHYQIYIALLKFDFFFFLGFTVQFLVIVSNKTGVELALTIAAIPVTIAILLFAAFFTRHETQSGVMCILVLYFGGLAYFFFKLVRIYQDGFKQNYAAVKKSLTAFAVLTIILIILTIINAIICMRNFDSGLKNHLLRRRAREDVEKPDVTNNAYPLQDQKPQMPSRMTID